MRQLARRLMPRPRDRGQHPRRPRVQGTRPPAPRLSRTRSVVSIESTSKVTWAACAPGGCAEAPLIERTVMQRRIDFGTSVPSQLLALQLLEQYDDLVERRRETSGERRRRSRASCTKRYPGGRLNAPLAVSPYGSTPVSTANSSAATRCATALPSLGTTASIGATARTHLRLCFARSVVELETGVDRLRRAYEDAIGRRERPMSLP